MSDQVTLTRDQYESLYEELHAASDKLPGTAVQERMDIRERIADVSEILSDFARGDLQQNTAAFAALKGKVAEVNAKVDALRADIAKIAGGIKVAVKIADALDKAISAAASLFGV